MTSDKLALGCCIASACLSYVTSASSLTHESKAIHKRLMSSSVALHQHQRDLQEVNISEKTDRAGQSGFPCFRIRKKGSKELWELQETQVLATGECQERSTLQKASFV